MAFSRNSSWHAVNHWIWIHFQVIIIYIYRQSLAIKYYENESGLCRGRLKHNAQGPGQKKEERKTRINKNKNVTHEKKYENINITLIM